MSKDTAQLEPWELNWQTDHQEEYDPQQNFEPWELNWKIPIDVDKANNNIMGSLKNVQSEVESDNNVSDYLDVLGYASDAYNNSGYAGDVVNYLGDVVNDLRIVATDMTPDELANERIRDAKQKEWERRAYETPEGLAILKETYEKNPTQPRGFWGNAGTALERGLNSATAGSAGYIGELTGIKSLQEVGKYGKLQLEMDNAYDPIKGDNWMSDIFHKTANMTGPMAVGMVLNTVAPGSGLAYWGTQGGGEILEGADKMGIDRSISVPLSVLGGYVYAKLEDLQVGQVLGKTGKSKVFNAVKQFIKEKGIKNFNKYTANSAVKLGVRTGINILSESAEESGQEAVSLLTQDLGAYLNDVFKGTDLASKIDWTKQAKQVGSAFTESLGPMALLSLGGGGGRYAYRQGKVGLHRYRKAKNLKENQPVDLLNEKNNTDTPVPGSTQEAINNELNEQFGVEESTDDQPSFLKYFNPPIPTDESNLIDNYSNTLMDDPRDEVGQALPVVRELLDDEAYNRFMMEPYVLKQRHVAEFKKAYPELFSNLDTVDISTLGNNQDPANAETGPLPADMPLPNVDGDSIANALATQEQDAINNELDQQFGTDENKTIPISETPKHKEFFDAIRIKTPRKTVKIADLDYYKDHGTPEQEYIPQEQEQGNILSKQKATMIANQMREDGKSYDDFKQQVQTEYDKIPKGLNQIWRHAPKEREGQEKLKLVQEQDPVLFEILSEFPDGLQPSSPVLEEDFKAGIPRFLWGKQQNESRKFGKKKFISGYPVDKVAEHLIERGLLSPDPSLTPENQLAKYLEGAKSPDEMFLEHQEQIQEENNQSQSEFDEKYDEVGFNDLDENSKLSIDGEEYYVADKDENSITLKDGVYVTLDKEEANTIAIDKGSLEQQEEDTSFDFGEQEQIAIEDNQTPQKEQSKTDDVDIGKVIDSRISQKYQDIYDIEGNEESEIDFNIEEKIENNQISSSELEDYISSLPENKRDGIINNIKAAIADKLGDLAETYRYESTEEGKRYEEYIDSLLKATEVKNIPDPRLPSGSLPAKTEQVEKEPVSDKGRITDNPYLKMPLDRVKQDAEKGVQLAKEALKEQPKETKSLTKEEKQKILNSLIDVYREAKLDKEYKGLDNNGNEKYGYPHNPDLFVKSDITGKMLRFYVTLPDGRIAHPTEVYSNIKQSDIDKKIYQQDEKEKQENIHKQHLKEGKEEAAQIFNKLTGKTNEEASINFHNVYKEKEEAIAFYHNPKSELNVLIPNKVGYRQYAEDQGFYPVWKIGFKGTEHIQTIPEIKKKYGTPELPFSKDDIDYQLAYDAYRGISFSPEKRAAYVQKEYYEVMKSFYNELQSKTPEENKHLINEVFDDYKEKYLSKQRAILHAKSRTMSPMITGPAKFPTARNEKRMSTEMKRINELLDWDKKARKAIKQKLEIIKPKAISSDDPNAISKLKKKIDNAEKAHQMMKDANAIIRKKKLSDEDKIKQLIELGLKESDVKQLLKPDYAGRKGFPRYSLTNNNANIKRMKSRLKDLEKKQNDKTAEIEFDGGTIVDNVEANRVQILFDDKPDAELRTRLKQRGFRWSPKNSAWQRQRTENAMYWAKGIVGADKEKPVDKKTAALNNWMKDSKVVDDDGKPKVVYHGTPQGGFTSFDPYSGRYGLFGQGVYLTENKEIAEEYAVKEFRALNKKTETNNQVYELYAKIKDPIDMDASPNVDAWQNTYAAKNYLLDDDIVNAKTNEEIYRALEESLIDERIPDYEGAEIMQTALTDMGHDGITHIGGGKHKNSDGTKHRVWIAFEPEQVKSVDNQGTFNPKDANIMHSISFDKPIDIHSVGEIYDLTSKYRREHNHNFNVIVKEKSPDGRRGTWMPDGITLYADQIQRGDLEGLLRHEDFVHGALKSIIGEESFNRLLNAVEKSDPVLYSQIKELYSKVKEYGESDYAEEVLAAYAQSKDFGKQGWFKIAVGRIKRWIKKMFGFDMSTADVTNMLEDAFRKYKKGKGRNQEGRIKLYFEHPEIFQSQAGELFFDKKTQKEINEKIKKVDELYNAEMFEQAEELDAELESDLEKLESILAETEEDWTGEEYTSNGISIEDQLAKEYHEYLNYLEPANYRFQSEENEVTSTPDRVDDKKAEKLIYEAIKEILFDYTMDSTRKRLEIKELGDIPQGAILKAAKDSYDRKQSLLRNYRKHSYAGINSKTADKSKLELAQELDAAGKSPFVIRKQTGWFKGKYDGKWRYEIKDKKLKLNMDEFEPIDNWTKEADVSLIDLINHPTLFQAYPELANMRIKARLVNRDSYAEGSYDPNDKTIKAFDTNEKRLKATIIHEIQHAIQDIEGFASGTNRNAIIRENDEKIKKELKEVKKQIIELEKQPTSKERDNKIAKLEKEYRTIYDSQSELDPYSIYKNHAGEIEARDVASRYVKDDDSEPFSSENIPEEEAFVRYNNKEAASHVRKDRFSPFEVNGQVIFRMQKVLKEKGITNFKDFKKELTSIYRDVSGPYALKLYQYVKKENPTRKQYENLMKSLNKNAPQLELKEAEKKKKEIIKEATPEIRQKEIKKGIDALKKKEVQIPDNYQPRSIFQLVNRAFQEGMERRKNMKWEKAIEDVIAQSFKRIAEMYKGDMTKWHGALMTISDATQNMLQDIENAGMDEEKKIYVAKQHLMAMFGEDRYHTIRRATRGNIFKTIKYLEKELQLWAGRYYARAFKKIMSRVDPDLLYNDRDSSLNFANQWREAIKDYQDLQDIANAMKKEKGLLKKLKKAGAKPSELKKIEDKIENWNNVIEERFAKTPYLDAKAAYETLAEIEANSARMQDQVLMNRDIKREALSNSVIDEVKKNKVLDPDEIQNRRGLFKNVLLDASGDMEIWATLLGGKKDSVSYDLFSDYLRKANTKVLTDVSRGHKELFNMFFKHGFATKDKYGKINLDHKKFHNMVASDHKKKRELINGEKILLSDAQIMDLYALTLDEDAYMKLKRNSFKSIKQKGGETFVNKNGDPRENELIIDDLVSRLTNTQREIVKEMVQYVTDLGTEANKTSLKALGREEFLSLSHWKSRVDRVESKLNADKINEMPAGFGKNSIFQQGFTKKRVNHSLPLILENVFDVFYDQVQDMAQYTHMSIPASDVINVMNASASVVNERFGKMFYQRMEKTVLKLAGLRKDSDGREGKGWNWINQKSAAIQRNIANSVLGFSVRAVIMNRIGGSILVANELMKIDPKLAADFSKRLTPINFMFSAENRRIREKLFENGFFYQRWEVDQARVYANLPVDEKETKSKRLLKKRKRQAFAMHMMSTAELRNTISAYKTLIKHGYSEADAIDLLEVITRKTQNPSTALEETGIYQQIKETPLYGLFVPFYGQPSVARNILIKDILSGDKKKITYSAAALTASALFTAALGYAMATAKKSLIWEDDDEEKKKQAMYASQRFMQEMTDAFTVPGAGRASDTILGIIKKIQKAKTADSALNAIAYDSDDELMDNLLLRVGKNTLAGSAYAIKGIRTGDQKAIEKGAIKLINAIGNMTGEPTGGITQAVEATSGALGYPIGKTEKKKRKKKNNWNKF